MKQFDAEKAGLEFDVALNNLVGAMYKLERVLEQYEGMEDIICDGFPFAMSYDEQAAAVYGWWQKVNAKVRG
jgi:hypothetical protein